jgi:hypothetical protein
MRRPRSATCATIPSRSALLGTHNTVTIRSGPCSLPQQTDLSCRSHRAPVFDTAVLQPKAPLPRVRAYRVRRVLVSRQLSACTRIAVRSSRRRVPTQEEQGAHPRVREGVRKAARVPDLLHRTTQSTGRSQRRERGVADDRTRRQRGEAKRIGRRLRLRPESFQRCFLGALQHTTCGPQVPCAMSAVLDINLSAPASAGESPALLRRCDAARNTQHATRQAIRSSISTINQADATSLEQSIVKARSQHERRRVPEHAARCMLHVAWCRRWLS